MTAALSNLHFTRGVSCAIAVVKANRVQGGATTNHVRREISISAPTYNPFLVNTFLFDCMFKEMILPHLKNSILAGFLQVKSSLESISLYSDKKCTKFLLKYFAHAQTVSTRPLLGGLGGGTPPYLISHSDSRRDFPTM